MIDFLLHSRKVIVINPSTNTVTYATVVILSSFFLLRDHQITSQTIHSIVRSSGWRCNEMIGLVWINIKAQPLTEHSIIQSRYFHSTTRN